MPGIIADILHQRSSRCDELYMEPAGWLVGDFDVHVHLNYGGQYGRRYFCHDQ
jgi:hypothetical protein